MKSKKILILARESPLGESDIFEKLRLTLGVTAAYKEHKVDLVLFDDAVYLMKIPDRSEGLEKFIKSFSLNDFNIFVDSNSARQRRVENNSLNTPFKSIERDELLNLLNESGENRYIFSEVPIYLFWTHPLILVILRGVKRRKQFPVLYQLIR